MSGQYEKLLAEVRAANAAALETTIAVIRAQDKAREADGRVVKAVQALSAYVESLEAKVGEAPS